MINKTPFDMDVIEDDSEDSLFISPRDDFLSEKKNEIEIIDESSIEEEEEEEFVEDKMEDENKRNKNKENKRLKERYEIYNTVLGKGEFGIVKKGLDLKKNKYVAIKIIDLKNLKIQLEEDGRDEEEYMKELYKEVEIMKKLDHKNILKVYDSFIESNFYYCILEYANNGTLLKKLEEKDIIEEELCKNYFKQLLNAIEYIHSKGISHRDISLDNICLNDEVIKIADFGCSDYFKNCQNSESFYGKAQYASPESIKGIKCSPDLNDIWGLGVCLFKMLTGYFPFTYSSDTIRGSFSIEIDEEPLSKECKDFLKKIFNLKVRCDLKMLKNHPWLNKK